MNGVILIAPDIDLDLVRRARDADGRRPLPRRGIIDAAALPERLGQ